MYSDLEELPTEFADTGSESIIAEVINTPCKEFHVSPFMSVHPRDSEVQQEVVP
jgi:hypothetical protein